jgi:NADP-dependent 3-hydroxy acid dehydrogenase YdfG
VQKIRDTALRRNLTEVRDRMAISPDAIARAVTYALEQPADVDVNEIVIRPTAQQ